MLYRIGCLVKYIIANILKMSTAPALPERPRAGDNKIVYLPGQSKGVLVPDPSLAERGMLMSTYEEFQIILTVALLIVAILNLKNK